MILEFLLPTFWVFLIFLGLRSSRIFKNNTELNNLTGYGFLLKSTTIIIMMLVFQSLSPTSNLFIDSKSYMKDTAILNRVFYISPILYLKFLTGIGETNEMVLKYLSNTMLWDKGHGLYNDSKNVVRFNSVLYFISRGNVFVHVVFMSLLSTLGIRFIVLAFKKYVVAYRSLFFILLFLLPSVFVSTGGVLKEPLLIFGIGVFLYSISPQCEKKSKWILFILGLFSLVYIKPYVLLSILIAVFFLFFSKLILSKKPWISLLVFSFFSFLIFIGVKPIRNPLVEYISRKQLDMERIAGGGLYVFENKENPRILYFKLEELEKLEIKGDSIQIKAPVRVGKSTFDLWEDLKEIKMEPSNEKWKISAYFPYKATSFFYTTPIRNSLSVFVRSIPEAFVNGLLRPFPTDPGSAYKYPAMLEVFFCLGIFVYALFNRKKIPAFEKRIIGSLAIFTVVFLILLGFTTPVIGALVRYRIPAFIALLLISFMILNIPEKWKNRIQ